MNIMNWSIKQYIVKSALNYLHTHTRNACIDNLILVYNKFYSLWYNNDNNNNIIILYDIVGEIMTCHMTCGER